MPGPKKTPLEIKEKRGTLRKDRTPVVQLASRLPRVAEADIPNDLGPVAREAWIRIVERAGEWIAISDRDALRLLCKAIEFHGDLEMRLAQDGVILYAKNGYAYAHPAVGMRASTEDSIRKWMATLGLTAADRASLGVKMVETQSAIDRFASRHNQATSKRGHRAG